MTTSSPHIHHPSHTVQTLMLQVILALLPGIICYVWFFGWGLLIQIMLTTVTALLCEALMLRLRKRPIKVFLADGSAVLTAFLLALCLPSLAPWWIAVSGTVFALVFAKHLYGGLGYNPFNPAMTGYVFLLISFPLQMTSWPAPALLTGDTLSFLATWQTVFANLPINEWDALTMATPLDHFKTAQISGQSVPLQAGIFAGFAWEWINLGFLVGGLWLIWRGIIQWHIPTAILLTLAVLSLCGYGLSDGNQLTPTYHLFSGATMLGAFFIATDPVTASTTPKGRLWFGFGIACLVYIIRSWGGYPDAIAFAVLIMNMTTPMLDHYTQPRVFGHRKEEKLS